MEIVMLSNNAILAFNLPCIIGCKHQLNMILLHPRLAGSQSLALQTRIPPSPQNLPEIGPYNWLTECLGTNGGVRD